MATSDAGSRRRDATTEPDAGPAEPPSICGNGTIELGEECDLGVLDGTTCVDLGYLGGELDCDELCGFDKTGCVEAACGNGVIDVDEECDGAALGPRDCVTEGFVDGPSGMEGRLQIFHAGAWGEVCDDYFDGVYDDFGYNDITVCQQLGYADGVFLSSYDAPSSVFILDDVNCSGTERRIGDCAHQPYGTENCFSTEGAGFRCRTHVEGDARLVAGTARNNGRIEVLNDGVWGTICDDFVSSAGARQTNFISVGCRQLGFSTAGTALTGSAVPDGVDPIWLDDLDCGGSEASVGACTSRGWGVHNCTHLEDVGLSCTP